MDIREAEKKREVLEETVLNLLREFERETGCAVSNVDLATLQPLESNKTRVVAVYIKAIL